MIKSYKSKPIESSGQKRLELPVPQCLAMERLLPHTDVATDPTNQPRTLPPGMRQRFVSGESPFTAGQYGHFPAVYHVPKPNAVVLRERPTRTPVDPASLEDLTTTRYGPFVAERLRLSNNCFRVMLSTQQLAVLEAHYKNVKYPDMALIAQCARWLDLDESRVKSWFRYRRANDRRMNIEVPTSDDRSHTSFRFSDQQRAVLESLFESRNYPDARLRKQCAQQIGVDEKRVKSWFIYRRAKDRRMKKKLEVHTYCGQLNGAKEPETSHSTSKVKPDAMSIERESPEPIKKEHEEA